MTRSYMGLDCIADLKTEDYTRLTNISLKKVPWDEQANYALYIIFFGTAILFMMILKRLLYLYNDYTTRKTGSNKISFEMTNKLVAIARYISYKRLPLMISRMTGLPPSIATLFLFFISFLFMCCYTFIPHFWYRECGGFGAPPLAVRSGMISLALVPFISIMSGKTNLISGVTGVSYEKLNVFHQALGWAALFFALVHTIPFLLQDSREGGISRITYQWEVNGLYRNGVPPLILLFLLTFGGLRIFRHYIYEVFWHLHWIMGLAYFGSLAWHTKNHNMGVQYIYGTLGLWSAQIIYRIIVKSPFRPNSNSYVLKHKEATVKALPNHLFEITVLIKENHELLWNPGQHIFIRFLKGIHTIDNHPFSIVTTPNLKFDELSDLKLVVKPQSGLTKKIYEDILNEKSLEKKYKVYIDGAYGGMIRDSLSFDKLILVSNGTGITATLPFMIHLAQNLTNPTNRVKCAEFIWIINDDNSLEWIKDQLIKMLNNIKKSDSKLMSMFHFDIFVTKPNENLDDTQFINSRFELSLPVKLQSSTSGSTDADSSSCKAESILHQFDLVDELNYKSYLNIHIGQKPVLKNYIIETPLLTKNAFIACGSSSLQNDVGNSVSELQKRILGRGSTIEEIYLHTENFGW